MSHISQQDDGTPMPENLFHPFPRFPAEIRAMIWRYNSPARFVEVYETHMTYEGTPAQDGSINWAARCATRNPVISRVCKESRDVFLQEYFIIAYENRQESPYINGPAVYVNPAIDTIFFDSIADIFSDSDDDDDKTNTGLYLPHLAGHMKESIEQQEKKKPEKMELMEKWGIRRLALNTKALTFMLATAAELYLFDGFVALEELVVLDKSEDESLSLEQRVVRLPNDKELEDWEILMQRLGRLHYRAMHSTYKVEDRVMPSLGIVYRTIKWVGSDLLDIGGEERRSEKWLKLKVTVAALAGYHGSDCPVDARGGFDMFGPYDQYKGVS